MSTPIKLLQQQGETFAPQTVAEAVVVKKNFKVFTLDLFLNRAVTDTPEKSGLVIENGVITHSSILSTTNTRPESLKIWYNKSGHIVETSPMTVNVNNQEYLFDDVKMGDDFEVDNDNNIKIKWNGIT